MGDMSKRGLTICTAGVLVALAGTPSAASAKSGECRVSGSKTLTASDTARVFVKRGRIYGCLYRTARPVLLDDDARHCDGPCSGVSRIVLSGRVVSWGRRVASTSAEAASVVRTDLRTRRSSTVWTSGPLNEETDSRIEALVGTQRGDIAWVASAFTQGSPLSHHLHVSVSGADTELDAANGLDPASVALSANRVYWIVDGQTRSQLLR